MDNAPAYAMQVSDLATSLAFFTENFGFTLVEQKPDEDVAYVLDSDGDPLLLVGPATQDLPSYLSAPKFVVNLGEGVGFGVDDRDALQAELISKGVTDLQVTQNRLGDRTLHVKAPDYTFEFIQPAEHLFEELLSLYTRSMNELDEALAGLSEAEMGLTLDEDSWSIRQPVHLRQKIAEQEVQLGVIPQIDGTCRVCHKSLQLDAEFCMYCGSTVTEHPKVCPNWATITLNDAKWCPKYRASLIA